MNVPANSSPDGRRRRSPRLAKDVTLKIAGRGPDGKILVESTRTCEISQHGASLTTSYRFPVGSAMAIQRPGAKPMRARVVTARPGPERGLQRLGVEFIGEEGSWDFEFPPEWQDSGEDSSPSPPPPANLDVAVARRTIAALDTSLEAVVRKGETLRAQAQAMLEEFAAEVESARRKSAAALASQRDSFAQLKSNLEKEFSEQARTAAAAIRAQDERSRAAMAQETAAIEAKFAALARQTEGALESIQQRHRQVLKADGHKITEIEARASAQLEARRKQLEGLEAEASRWREQTSTVLAKLSQEAERLAKTTRGEIQAAALDTAKQFRQQRLPALGDEVQRFFGALLAQQKTATTQWLEQEWKTIRAGFLDAEKAARAALEEHTRQALERYESALQERLQQARDAGQAIATPIEARLQRTREALKELTAWSERAIATAKAEWEGTVSEAEKRLGETLSTHQAALGEAATQGVHRLQQMGDSLEANALDAARRLDRSGHELQEMGTALDRRAVERRQELESSFASLLALYDQRKATLDRLLETLENSRTFLRAGLESLRTSTEENQAGLRRLSAEQEAALNWRAQELERKLEATSVTLEATLGQRAAASLEASHQAFSEGLEQAAKLSLERFRSFLGGAVETAERRVLELAESLERSAEHQNQALAELAAGHAASLDQARQHIEEQAATGLESLGRSSAVEQEALKQAAAAAAAAVADRQAQAESAIGEMLGRIQEARVTLMRDHTEMESQVRQKQQALEARFSALSSAIEEKRAALDSFSAYVEQSRAALLESLAGLDSHVEKACSILHGVQRDVQAALDKQAAGLTKQLHQTLQDCLSVCEHEFGAMSEAAYDVFQARLREVTDQATEAARRTMEHAGDTCAMTLDRTMQKERRDAERRTEDLARAFEASIKEQHRVLQESAAATLRSLNDQMQQLSRQATVQAGEFREKLLRELPARLADAEIAFRQSVEKIREQVLRDASAALRSLSSHSLALPQVEAPQQPLEVAPERAQTAKSGEAE